MGWFKGGLYSVFAAGLLMVIPTAKSDDDIQVQVCDLLTKTFLISTVFFLIVLSYDVEETCKPGWLDYLG
jgi:hypothetical protein